MQHADEIKAIKEAFSLSHFKTVQISGIEFRFSFVCYIFYQLGLWSCVKWGRQKLATKTVNKIENKIYI